MRGKEFSWKSVSVSLGGVELTGVRNITFKSNKSILELKKDLKIAEQNEQYELCSELQKEIKVKEKELFSSLLNKVKGI